MTELTTKLIHLGRHKRYTQGGINSVIQRASSIVFDSLSDKKYATSHYSKGALFYGRKGTLTHFALQEVMCELEGGEGCYLYPSGLAAISHAILAFVDCNDHILVSSGAYEPTKDVCNMLLKKFKVTTTFFDPMIGENITALIQPHTKILFLESPSSLTMEVPDVPAIVKVARTINPDIVIMIDNTWGAGILFPALKYDIDISIQAGTKYLVGHSDVMIGTAVANKRCWAKLRDHAYGMGQIVDADSAYMTIRGIRTLATRLKQHEQNGLIVARWLAQRKEVKAVYHPALSSCIGHEYFMRDFSGASGLFSFELHQKLTETRLAKFVESCQLFAMAFSWGGFESLILANQPEDITQMRPNVDRTLQGTLIRLHVGLESPADLIQDLTHAFAQIESE